MEHDIEKMQKCDIMIGMRGGGRCTLLLGKMPYA